MIKFVFDQVRPVAARSHLNGDSVFNQATVQRSEFLEWLVSFFVKPRDDTLSTFKCAMYNSFLSELSEKASE